MSKFQTEEVIPNSTNANEGPNELKSAEKLVQEIPAEKLVEYKDAFDIVDVNHSGSISVKELASLFIVLGFKISESDIKDQIDSVDTTGSGEVSFQEFVYLLLKVESLNEHEEDEVRKAFKIFDKNGNGLISLDEFKLIHDNLGNKFMEVLVEEIFNEIDLDGDGQINYKEFEIFWRHK